MYQQHLINLEPQKSKDNIGIRTLEYLKSLRKDLPLCQLIDQSEDLSALQTIANHTRAHYKDVIILGTGGSSLGGQSLCTLASNADIRLHFHDNIDPDTFARLFQQIDPKFTKIIAISKSGNTSETLMQLLTCIHQWQKQNLDIKNHFLIISEPGENAIREIAQSHQCPTLDHPTTIGGRFAAFTLVGLLPAMIVGLDVLKIRLGARWVMDQVEQALNPEECAPLVGALIQKSLLDYHVTQSVVMPYIDRLSVFAMWYRQLWAESLGKQGKGTTPIRAVGTIDQHSQLQLYLDGPKDKFFTLITLQNASDTFKIHEDLYTHSALTIFKDKSMGDLMQAEQRATIDTLVNNNCPTRVLSITQLNEEVMGALMMHYVLETLAMAFLLEVNPFDQPAVEESKILTRHYLTTVNKE